MSTIVFLAAALAAVFLALWALLKARRQQRAAGLPPGRVIYADASRWGQVEKPLFDPILELTGKPDYLVEEGEGIIPVEVKSTPAPDSPYESHVFQLAAYCLLVERSLGRRPPYGILAYRGRSFAIDYTPQLESALMDVLAELRRDERRQEIERSHDDPARCARCGYRSICDQKAE